MSTRDNTRGQEHTRRDRQIDETVHDSYKARYKPQEPSVCPTCGVLYEHGHWHWKPRPADASEHLCPACHRIKDKYPAGHVTLEGKFLAEHREELMQLVRNEEAQAKAEHPMERIMSIEQDIGGKTLITTTDLHLPARIGNALHHAYQGTLDTKYSKDEYFVRVRWQR